MLSLGTRVSAVLIGEYATGVRAATNFCSFQSGTVNRTVIDNVTCPVLIFSSCAGKAKREITHRRLP